MKIYHLFLLSFTVFPINSFAQNSLEGFNKLDQKQLNLTEVDFEKDAKAVILDEVGSMTINESYYSLIVKKRIKILNKSAFDIGDVLIPYYRYNNIEEITNVKAQTIILENGEYKNFPIEVKDIYNINLSSLYNAIKFALPNIQIGSIIEYQYTKIGRNIFSINAWDFQHDFPTLSSRFSLNINANYNYKNFLIGNKLISKYKDKNDKSKVSYWHIYDIPSFKDIKYVYNNKSATENIILQLSGYKTVNGKKYEINNWADLKNKLIKNNDIVQNPTTIKKYNKSIPNEANDKETLDLVINQFKKDFKWNNIRGIYANKNQKDILDSHYGSIADLNILLNSILKNKGFNCELILLSSRENGKIFDEFPNLDQFDYLVNIVTLKDGTNYVINAADIPENTYVFAPLTLFNDHGLILDKGSTVSFIKLNQFISENSVEFTYKFTDKDIIENRLDVFNGYFYDQDFDDSKNLINQYVKSPLNVYDDEIGNKIEFVGEKYTVKNKSRSALEANNFHMIENPMEHFISAYTFNEKDRTNKIEFNFPYYIKVMVKVDVPKDYEVLGKNDFKAVVKEGEGLIYSQAVAQKENNLQILYEFYIGNAVHEANEYDKLKTFFESVQKEISKQITLKKK